MIVQEEIIITRLIVAIIYKVIQGGIDVNRNYDYSKQLHQIDTGNQFFIYKVANRVFQLGEINFDKEYIHSIIKILDRGFKFIPCYHFSNFHIFKSLLLSLENEMFNFNRQLFFKKISLEKSKTFTENTENIEVNLN